MIGFVDALTLARTKLRAKRILLIITVVVSGLLFGVLSTALFVSTGITRSTESFFTKALDSRYLVEVQPNIPNDILGYGDIRETSKELVKQLTAMQDTYIAKQKAIYDKYKLPFDKTTVTPILQADPFGGKDSSGNPTKIINRDSPVYQDYLKQQKQDYIKTAKNTVTDLKKIAGPAGATDYYGTRSVSLQSQSTYLKDGKETFKPKTNDASTVSYMDYLTSNVKDTTYMFTDQTLIKRFIYPENEARKQTKDAIPVVLTTQEIAKMFGTELGIDKQPTKPAEQVAWTKNLQQKANGYVYSVCYRSTGETTLIQKTMQANTEIAEKQNDKNYTPPSLQYNLPTTPCGELTVKKDTRTTAEKKEATTQESIQKDLGTYQPLDRRILKFQIVGSFTLADVTSQAQDATAYISYLLGPQYTNGSFIPQQLYDALPATVQNKDILFQTGTGINADYQLFENAGIKNTIVSFPTLAAARDFIKNDACEIYSSDCDKPFKAGTYGSSYLAADEISKFIQGVAPVALTIAMVIATIIIWVTMARVIIDSRRETAVFRALGAKRKDIASIYLLYSLLVASLIVIFMLVAGFIAANVVEALFSPQATDLAKVAYGVFDDLEPFHFIGIDVTALTILTGCIFGISIIAVLPPLWRNVRRSPIRDMRDE